MRRKKQLLSKDEIEDILNRHTAGVLGVNGDQGYPYTVPMSYAYRDNKIFFHCGTKGHKLDSIKKDDKVTFCVIDRDDVDQETFNTFYKSVSIFGRARILAEEKEIQSGLELIIEKYSPNFLEKGLEYIKDEWNRVCLVVIDIEHMTGKASLDIVTGKVD